MIDTRRNGRRTARLWRGIPAALALVVSLGAAAQTTPPAPPRDNATTSEAIQALLDQASYWRIIQTGQAVNSLQRVLALDPVNADGLALLAQIEIDQNLPTEATATLTRLRTAHPQDARIALLEQSLRDGPPDPVQLAEARSQAQAGNKQASVDAYRKAFKGENPPLDYAIEYYLTLAGIEGQFETARAGLGKIVLTDPQDLPNQLAYAQLLSYNEATRADAIDRLQALAQQPSIKAAARRAWRQALIWQGADYRSQAQLDIYLRETPNDPEMLAKREEYKGSLADSGTRQRLAGFEALEQHHVPEAEKQFQGALAFNPKDADSLIMMAVIRKFQGRQAEARRLEQRAVDLAPDRREDYLTTFAGNGSNPGGQQNGQKSGGRRDNGASRAVAEAYARVNRLARNGDFAAAETLLRRQMKGRPVAGNFVQLGYLQFGAGKLGEAEASFRRVIKMNPRNSAGLSGLAAVLARRGDTIEAAKLYARAGNRDALRSLGQTRATQLRAQAHDAHDPLEKLRLSRAALDADPSDPWLRLELARVLRNQDHAAEANQVMNGVAQGHKPTQGDLEASVLWAQESDDLGRTAELIATVPAKRRTPVMVALATRAQTNAELRQAQAGDAGQVTTRLLAVAAHPDPTGTRGVAVARALLRAGDRPAAVQAVTAALGATKPPTAVQRLAYATFLSRAKFDDQAATLVRDVNPTQLPPADRSSLSQLQDGLAIQRSDRLNTAGRRDVAFDVLKPRLQQEPENTGLTLALSRLYQGDQKPKEALALTEAAMKREPYDLDVRRAFVGAAVQAREIGRAQDVTAESLESAPDDPRAYLMAAAVAQAHGRPNEALSALRKARELRQQQIKDNPPQDESTIR